MRANYRIIVKDGLGHILQDYNRYACSCGIENMRKEALKNANNITYPYIRIYKQTANKTIMYSYLPVLELWIKESVPLPLPATC